MVRKLTWSLVALGVAFCAGVLIYIGTRSIEAPVPSTQPLSTEEQATTTSIVPTTGTPRIIGYSVEGRPIEVYTFGIGPTEILFVGGIHGGYEWNSVVLAYTVIEHFTTSPTSIPSSVRVSIIPNLNPDGVFAGVGKEGRFTEADVVIKETNGVGRFNARGVDLNRNFDCKWQPEAQWRGNKVGAGTGPFSEPEALTLKEYVAAQAPDAVIFWHSKANAVYASECENGILPATRTLMNTYAQAAGYPTVDVFDAYPVTGDAEGWLASIGIPAITVELAGRETAEWEKNVAAVQAVLSAYNSSS
jgi:predicted deacylase